MLMLDEKKRKKKRKNEKRFVFFPIDLKFHVGGERITR